MTTIPDQLSITLKMHPNNRCKRFYIFQDSKFKLIERIAIGTYLN